MQVEVLPKNYQLAEMKSTVNDDSERKLDRCIKRIIEKEGFVEYKIDKRCVSTNGGNYLGELYEVDVKGRTTDTDKELNIFVKNIIQLESIKILSITQVYNSEMFAYKELSKIFAELQEEANVPTDEKYKMVKVYDETNAEAIIMENVNRKGFTTSYRMDVLSLKFLEIAVKELAKFHGLSFVIKKKRPDYFENRIKSLKNPFIFNDEWPAMVKNVRDTALENVDEKFQHKVEKVNDNLLHKFSKYVNDESIQVCLCHGDYRANNIMVKIAEGDVEEIIPVDYQLIHYGCPVFDFLYLIFTGTDREFRKAHMTYLKDVYCETFGHFLGYFDLDINEVYPRKQFEEVYKEKLDYGLMMSLFLLPFILASESNVPDLSKECLLDTSFQVDARYKDRLQGVLEEYTELGFL